MLVLGAILPIPGCYGKSQRRLMFNTRMRKNSFLRGHSKNIKAKQIRVVAQENEEIGAAFVLVGVWESDGLSGGNDLSDSLRGTISSRA